MVSNNPNGRVVVQCHCAHFVFMENEIWKPVAGYNRFYEVSNMGRIRTYHVKGSKTEARKIEPKIMCPGYSSLYQYLSITLSKGIGVRKIFMVHRLVAAAFLENPLNLSNVNHIDGDKLNNSSENLEWCTLSQNQKHAYDTGLRQKSYGQKNGRTILSNEQVLKIFSSNDNHYKIASEFGVSRLTVGHIKSGKIWGQLTGKMYAGTKTRVVLPDEIVLAIFADTGQYADIAQRFGVTSNIVGSIKTGRGYSMITGKKFLGKREYTYYGVKNSVGRRTQDNCTSAQ